MRSPTMAALLLLAVTATACARTPGGRDGTAAAEASPIASPLVAALRPITTSGGRLDWYHGPGHDLIAFDGPVGRGRTELFTMRPDGSDRRCVTCGLAAVPRGFIGQPAWHPDGDHLVIQAEGDHSAGSLFNHMAWGIDNDLWLVDRAGRRAERIWRSPQHHGALHPHFDATGRRLVFAERVATGRVVAPRAARYGAGGENQWTGWRVHLADVDLGRAGPAILSNHRRLFQDRPGFYEVHGFAADGDLVFSHTADGRPFVDDIYRAAPSGGPWTPLVASPATWDEHGNFAPSGRALAFVSSRADRAWRAPRSRARTLRTELYLRRPDGAVHRLTRFNDTGRGRFLVSDFAWDREGRRIAFQLAPMRGDWRNPPPPEIWMLTFHDPQ